MWNRIEKYLAKLPCGNKLRSCGLAIFASPPIELCKFEIMLALLVVNLVIYE